MRNGSTSTLAFAKMPRFLARTAAANGRRIWECYVWGFDPTDLADDLVIRGLYFENGHPKLDYDQKEGRVYVEEGKTSLTNAWHHPITDEDRFFRVRSSLRQ